MKYIFKLILILVFFTSCGEYQKALKSDDSGVKIKVANELYEKEKYAKAIRLYEQIEPEYRGKPQGERMFYMFAQSYFKTEQYALAGYKFETFVSGYPRSDKLEEASFLGAKCYTFLSPRYSLDQIDTEKGINKLQVFINAFPNSSYLEEANLLVKTLREKIERKTFENAVIYNKIARYAADHKAAMISVDNFLADFPGTPYQEEALFYKFDSAYKLAVNSVESKKEERLIDAKKAYESLLKFKADTKFKSQVDLMMLQVEQELKTI
jgi:outer membrane protein assembly factor BamD